MISKAWQGTSSLWVMTMRAEGSLYQLTGFRKDGKIWSRLTLDIDRPPEEVESFMDHSLDVNIAIHREHRSVNANAALWHCIGAIAKALGEDKDKIYLDELVKYGVSVTYLVRPDVFIRLSRIYRLVRDNGSTTVVDPDTHELEGRIVAECYIGSSEYNSTEFAHLLSGVIDDMREMGLGNEAPTSAEMKRIIADLEERDRKVNGRTE